MISDVVIKYDGLDLTESLDLVEAPDFGLLPDVQNNVINNQYVSSSMATPTLTFNLYGHNKNWTKLRDDLNRILNVDEPKKLEISIFSDRYWFAKIDGQSSFVRLMENSNEISASITFIIPEGMAHSTTEIVSNASVIDDVLKLEINYDGTVETPLRIDVHNNDETGYIGLIGMHNDSENTFITQLGDVNEADGEIRNKSVVIRPKEDGKNFNDWQDATAFYENQSKSIVTTMSSTAEFGGWLKGFKGSLTNTGNKPWFGAAKEFIVPTPTDYFYLWGRAWFETGKMGQTGEWCLSFIDEDNRLICAMALEKNDTVGNTAQLRFLHGNGGTASITFKTINFTPSYWIPPNPYGTQSRNTNRNMFDMRKEGSQITYFWNGGYYKLNVEALKNKKVKRVQFYLGQYKGRTASQLVTHMGIRDILMIDLKSEYWVDVPNRFVKGSDVIITENEESKIIYRDGIKTLEDVWTGSVFPYLKPGKNTIEIAYSNFTDTPPNVKATYEKRYL